jgi:hypothetical protein
MTEEVQVTSLSTYLPVTLWGGSSKMLGGCKKNYYIVGLRNVSQCRVAQSVSKHDSDLFPTKIVSLTVSIRNMVVESRQTLYSRDLGFSSMCEFIL